MNRISCLVPILCLLIFLTACAFDVARIKQIPTSLELSHRSKMQLELEEEVKVTLNSGFKRTLKAKTKWEYVGKTIYGDVLKTNDQVLTVEASNIYEAYLVVSFGKLVGFYLPVEKCFSPLTNPKVLKLKKIEDK